MEHFICKTCGTQFPASEQSPLNCPICEDERQYIGWEGQQCILQKNHHNAIKTVEPNLIGIAHTLLLPLANRRYSYKHPLEILCGIALA